MSSSDSQEFGKIRYFFWPIHTHEHKKFLPMFFMLLFICFCYSILRNMKDAVVITKSGAEVVPFIKVWVMLPMAVLLTYLFNKLTNRFSQERVFYLMISSFLVFFAVFAFILYPLRDCLHFDGTDSWLATVLPQGFRGMLAMCHNWTFTLFYVISELWGSFVMGVLFWGFANEVTRLGEARRFYSAFMIGSNTAAILAGQAAVYFSGGGLFNPTRQPIVTSWQHTLHILVVVVIGMGLIVMGLFWWMNKNVLTDKSFDDLHTIKKETKKKGKLSMRESFSFLSNSKYLLCLAFIVVAYNLTINLAEIIWKEQLRQLYPSPADFNIYMGHLTTTIGFISLLTAFTMPRIISRFGWTFTALLTPIVMLVTCTGFFGFLIFNSSLAGIAIGLTGASPLAIAVFFGSAQNCLSKSAKYSVFDATKEMAFIPLSHESKLKGKAAIDGIGSRFGKSGGSLIHQGLLMIFFTLSASTPYVGVIILGTVALWVTSVRSLGKQFNSLAATHGETPEGKEAKVEEKPSLVTA